MHETKWLPVVPTRALHQEGSGGARRLRARRTRDSVSFKIPDPAPVRACACARAQTGSSSAIISGIKLALTPLRSTKPPLAHYCTRPSHGRRDGLVRKARHRPWRWEAANIKKGWPYYERERCFSFSFFSPPPPRCRRGEGKVIMAAWYVLFIHFADVYLLFNSRVR